MSRIANEILRDDFLAFARFALSEDLGGSCQPYIKVLCGALTDMERETSRKVVVNLPPGHLKTRLCSVAFTAWMLGRHPELRVMIVSCSESLAHKIAGDIRDLLRQQWFRELFPDTGIAPGKGRVMEYETTRGGGVFATSRGARITGFRADFIILDDLVEIGDADDEDLLERANAWFDTIVVSRLNNRLTGRILVVAHRLHERDLSGYVLERGDYVHVCMPFIAGRDTVHTGGTFSWHRKAGELLRPDAFSPADMKEVRATLNPDYETLWQQNPGGELAFSIQAGDFSWFEPRNHPPGASGAQRGPRAAGKVDEQLHRHPGVVSARREILSGGPMARAGEP